MPDSAPLKASMRELMRERRRSSAGDDDNVNIFDTQQLIFGCVPARNAARMDPIEALRHE